MYDAAGKKIRIGSRVKLWDGNFGYVVCSLDDDEYTSDFPRSAWDHLKIGIIIRTDRGGVIHYDATDEDLELIDDQI